MQEVEAKKTARVDALQRQTAARNKKEVEAWSRRMGERENEAKRREHAERLKQLSVRCSYIIMAEKLSHYLHCRCPYFRSSTVHCMC